MGTPVALKAKENVTAGLRLAPVCFAQMGMAIITPTKNCKSVDAGLCEQVEAKIKMNMAKNYSQKISHSLRYSCECSVSR